MSRVYRNKETGGKFINKRQDKQIEGKIKKHVRIVNR